MTLPILVDCDGVLSDMTGSVLQLAREKAQVFDKGPEDVTDWDYGVALGWPGANQAITDAVRYREFVYRMKPYVGAFTALRELEAAFGASNVIVCTAPWGAEWAAQRYAWLEEFAKVPMHRVIMTVRKDLTAGFLVDDYPENFVGRARGWLVTQPHNEAFRLSGARPGVLHGTLQQAVDYLVAG